MNDKHPELKGRHFETGQELWQAMSELDFDETCRLSREDSRLRSLGHYRNKKIKGARNLLERFLRRQNRLNIKNKLLPKKHGNHYPKPLPNPKSIDEIWQNLTDKDYQETYRLHCAYYNDKKYNAKTRLAVGLISKFRQHCKQAGFDYPNRKKVTGGFKQSKKHPWQAMIKDDIQRARHTN